MNPEMPLWYIWIPAAIALIPYLTEAFSKLNLSPRVMSLIPMAQGLVLAFLWNLQGGMSWKEALFVVLQGIVTGSLATQARQVKVNWRKTRKLTP